MYNLNNALKDANVYSIEYCGYFILRVSVSSELEFYDSFQDIKIEFITGCSILDINNNALITREIIFDLYGKNIVDAALGNNQLRIEFENGNKIISLNDYSKNRLVDRCWNVGIVNDNENYLMNDTNELFISNKMKKLLKN